MLDTILSTIAIAAFLLAVVEGSIGSAVSAGWPRIFHMVLLVAGCTLMIAIMAP